MTTKIEVEIDGIKYNLNVESAKNNGSLLPKGVQTFEVGDVFRSHSHSPIFIVKPIYTTSDNEEITTPCFGFLGLSGLMTYCDFRKLYTRGEVLKYINDHGLGKTHNIRTQVLSALNYQ